MIATPAAATPPAPPQKRRRVNGDSMGGVRPLPALQVPAHAMSGGRDGRSTEGHREYYQAHRTNEFTDGSYYTDVPPPARPTASNGNGAPARPQYSQTGHSAGLNRLSSYTPSPSAALQDPMALSSRTHPLTTIPIGSTGSAARPHLPAQSHQQPVSVNSAPTTTMQGHAPRAAMYVPGTNGLRAENGYSATLSQAPRDVYRPGSYTRPPPDSASVAETARPAVQPSPAGTPVATQARAPVAAPVPTHTPPAHVSTHTNGTSQIIRPQSTYSGPRPVSPRHPVHGLNSIGHVRPGETSTGTASQVVRTVQGLGHTAGAAVHVQSKAPDSQIIKTAAPSAPIASPATRVSAQQSSAAVSNASATSSAPGIAVGPSSTPSQTPRSAEIASSAPPKGASPGPTDSYRPPSAASGNRRTSPQITTAGVAAGVPVRIPTPPRTGENAAGQGMPADGSGQGSAEKVKMPGSPVSRIQSVSSYTPSSK